MLKVVIQILIITFILVLFYDTIDIYLNQINSKNENELLIVKREIEETNQQVESITPYENFDFPIWPITLGFSCVFCSVLCHFILPLNCLSWKRSESKGDPHQSLSKLSRSNKNNKKENDELCYQEINENFDSKNFFDKEMKDQVVYHGLTAGQGLSDEKDNLIGSLPQFTGGQETSIINVCIPTLFHGEMFPAQSSFDPINNISLSPSMTSLDRLDCSKSKNLYGMLLENNSISKLGLPATPRSCYEEENKKRKHFSKTYCEKKCETIYVNKAIFEENTNDGSEDSNDSISNKQGQMMGIFSMSNNNYGAKPPQATTSDKSINVQLLTYNDNDIKNIEKRLENVEIGLRRSEVRSKDWDKRINVAETELVDLHEQMYTIFSKFEEEKKTNYIIVSKVSKDKIFPKQKEVIDNLSEESDEQVEEKGDDDTSKNKLEGEKESSLNPVSDMNVQKDSSEESEVNKESENDNKSNDGDSQLAIEDSTEVLLAKYKQKSVAIEALLESKSRFQNSKFHPKRKIPQIKVPPHILPPYKRSSFAGTDSKVEIGKRKLNMNMPKSGNDFYWRARM